MTDQSTVIIQALPIKGYHAYKVKVPLGGAIPFEKDTVVPEYDKILAKFEGRPVGSVAVPLNNILFKIWDCVQVSGIVDGEPRFGGLHRYQRATTGRRATAGGGAYHTAKITIKGEASALSEVVAAARDMGLSMD